MNIGKAIYGILSGTTAVTDIVGTKIFPEIAEQETAVPFVIYQVQSVQPEDTHDGPSKLDEVRVEVLCYDDAYNGAADLASAVRGALDRVRGTYNGVNVESVQFNDVDFEIEYDPRRYSQVLTFTFRIKRDDIEIALGTPITGAQLGDLSDVNVTGVTDNQILSYDAETETWVPAADAGGPDVLDDLSDVDTGEPADGQMLAYQQGTWSAIYQDEITLPIASVTGLQAELNTIPDALDDLDDVKIIGTPAEGEALVYQSGFWSRGTAGASTLGDLDDVNTTGAAAGSLISYNGVDGWEISAAELPDDAVYYHNRYLTEAAALRSGATETVELYYTAQADGDGLSESASSDTPTSGYDIQRKLWYAEKAQADPDTSADWTQFTPIGDNTTFNNAKAALLAYLKERTGGTVPISLKMTWEEVSQVSYLLDDYSGAAAAYSLRLLSSTYSGDAINVWNGTSYADIGFDGSGELDTTALAAHCGSNDGFIRYWYDQSGNSNDATQTTTGSMPKIYDGATTSVVTENGKPAVQFDGSDDYLVPSITNSASDYSLHAVTKNSATNSFLFDTSAGRLVFDARGGTRGVYYDGSWHGTQHSGTAQELQSIYAIAPSSGQSYVNGSQINTGLSYTQTAIGGTTVLGTIYNIQTSFMIIGTIQEFVLYPSDQSSNRTGIETNINTFYSIY